MTIVIIILWLTLTVLAKIHGSVTDEQIYLGTTIILAAQYVRASITEQTAKMDGGKNDA